MIALQNTEFRCRFAGDAVPVFDTRASTFTICSNSVCALFDQPANCALSIPEFKLVNATITTDDAQVRKTSDAQVRKTSECADFQQYGDNVGYENKRHKAEWAQMVTNVPRSRDRLNTGLPAIYYLCCLFHLYDAGVT